MFALCSCSLVELEHYLISALSRLLTAIPSAGADDPAIAPFTSTFLRMMFAHAEFEARAHEVRMLAGDEFPGPMDCPHAPKADVQRDPEAIR